MTNREYMESLNDIEFGRKVAALGYLCSACYTFDNSICKNRGLLINVNNIQSREEV